MSASLIVYGRQQDKDIRRSTTSVTQKTREYSYASQVLNSVNELWRFNLCWSKKRLARPVVAYARLG